MQLPVGELVRNTDKFPASELILLVLVLALILESRRHRVFFPEVSG